MSIQTSEQTTLQSYKLVYTSDSKAPDTEPTAFPIGIPDGHHIDLHDASWGGKGVETKANRLCHLFLTDAAGAATVFITGACEGGPEEPICKIVLGSGGTVESGTDVWMENGTLTSYHLAEDAIVLAGESVNQPCKLGFDAIGYRYIKYYVFTHVTVTWVKIYTRYF